MRFTWKLLAANFWAEKLCSEWESDTYKKPQCFENVDASEILFKVHFLCKFDILKCNKFHRYALSVYMCEASN